MSKAAKANPKASVCELLAGGESVEEVSQIIVTLPRAAHDGLKRLADGKVAKSSLTTACQPAKSLTTRGIRHHGVHLSSALEPSNEVGPPHLTDFSFNSLLFGNQP